METLPINIVVVGKSGSGKSSLCNYLFERPDFFRTGTGKPVTSWEENFQSFSFDYNGHVLNVFDSVGLEPDNYSKWKDKFNSFVNERRADIAVAPENWIHGAFYVINANSARLEPVDQDLIRLLSKGLRIPLQVILTNADVAGDKVAALKKEIQDSFTDVPVTAVCSVSLRKRGGQTTEPFGRNDVLQLYVQQSYEFLSRRLAVLTCRRMLDGVRTLRAQVIESIKAADLSVFKLDELDLDSTFNFEFFDDAFDDLRSFDDYLMSFGFTGDWEFSEELEHATNRALEEIEEEMTAKFEQLDRDLESGSFWEKTKAVLTMGKMALTIERTVLCYVNEAFDRLEVSLVELLQKYARDEIGVYVSGVLNISAIVASALGAGAGFALRKLGR